MNDTIEIWKVNDELLARLLQIKENDQRKVKKGFKTWLNYIRQWKQ